MNVGQPFNPHGCFNGAFTPFSVLRLPDLSLGAKVLYGRLSAFAGRDGACYPSREKLAAELGISVATIKRHLAELTQAKLIRRELPETIGRGQTARVVFLWHEALAGSLRKGVQVEPLSPPEEGGQPEPLSRTEGGQNRAERGSKSTHERGSKSTHAHKEEKEPSEKNYEKSTSSSFTSAGVTDQGGASPTTAPPIEGKAKTPDPEPGRWWTPEQFENARTWLDAHRTGYSERRTVIVRDGDGAMVGYVPSATVGGAGGRPPDAEITRRILTQFSGYVEFQRWLFGLALPRGGIENYGFYLHDAAKNWPTRRPAAGMSSTGPEWGEVVDWSEREDPFEVREEAKRRQDDGRHEGALAANVSMGRLVQVSAPSENIGENEENAPKLTGEKAGVLPSAPCCPRCVNSGVRFVDGDFGLVEFCVCPDGERKRREDPALVETENRRFQRLQRLQALAEAAA